jgi:trimethylamine:corrinoid methyltransferase-like protein
MRQKTAMIRNGLTSAIGMGLNIFSQNELETIHHGACHILKHTGVMVEMEAAAEHLSSAGAWVSKKRSKLAGQNS